MNSIIEAYALVALHYQLHTSKICRRMFEYSSHLQRLHLKILLHIHQLLNLLHKKEQYCSRLHIQIDESYDDEHFAFEQHDERRLFFRER